MARVTAVVVLSRHVCVCKEEPVWFLCRASTHTTPWATPVETPPRILQCMWAVLGCQWRRVHGRRACSATWPGASQACTTSWRALLKGVVQLWKVTPWREQVWPWFWQLQVYFCGRIKKKKKKGLRFIDIYFGCITNLSYCNLSLREYFGNLLFVTG